MIRNIVVFLVFSGLSVPAQAALEESPNLVVTDRLTLTVPRLDFDDIPGFYQDVIIEYHPAENSWNLVQSKRGFKINGTRIDTVELILTQEPPIQAFLEVAGWGADGCEALGPVHVQLTENRFDVVLYYDLDRLKPGEDVACAAIVTDFLTVVPLPIYSLEAGEYSYVVNDEFEGSFVLDIDNDI